MNALGEAFRAALASLNAHRLRSFLTTLGILIGTMAVIAVVSVLQGFTDSIRDQFSDLGSNSLTLQAVNEQQNFRTGRINTLSFEDIEVLRYRVPGVQNVAPILRAQLGAVSWKTRNTAPQILGSTEDAQATLGVSTFKGRFLTKLLTTGAKRRESLGVIISTPGSTPDNLYGEIIATCEQVLRGEVEDDSMMPMLFGLDPTDADDDPEIWPKANPGIEYGQPDPKSLRRAFQTRRQSPAGRAEWNRYHCCRMTEGGHNWLDMQKFPLGNLPNSTELEGRAAWIGLDLSKRGDMTALVVAIPLEDGRIALEGHYWWPAQDVAQRELDYRLPIRTCAASGKITLTPGAIINYEEIAERIDQLALRYKIQMIAYDQYGARDLVAMLTEHNLPIQAYSMGVATFAPGCQLWQRLWVGERLCLGEDPILRAACRSAIARRDRIGNITIGKERDSSTIDALVAAIIAVHSWGGDSQSVYEQSLF